MQCVHTTTISRNNVWEQTKNIVLVQLISTQKLHTVPWSQNLDTWRSHEYHTNPVQLRYSYGGDLPLSPRLALERPHIAADILHVSISLIKIKNTAPFLLIN